jgi:hypothetical protein
MSGLCYFKYNDIGSYVISYSQMWVFICLMFIVMVTFSIFFIISLLFLFFSFVKKYLFLALFFIGFFICFIIKLNFIEFIQISLFYFNLFFK